MGDGYAQTIQDSKAPAPTGPSSAPEPGSTVVTQKNKQESDNMIENDVKVYHNVLMVEDCWRLCGMHWNCLTFKFAECTNVETCPVISGNCFLYSTHDVVFIPSPPRQGRARSWIDRNYVYGFRICQGKADPLFAKGEDKSAVVGEAARVC